MPAANQEPTPNLTFTTSGAAILYQTQSIVRQYPANADVPAAISLFGSLMTMFWYVLRLFMRLSSD